MSYVTLEIKGKGVADDPLLRRLIGESNTAPMQNLSAFTFSLLAGVFQPWVITVRVEADDAARLCYDHSVISWRVVDRSDR